MIVRDVERILESWAPKEIAWERDNVGLQVGDHDRRVKKILVTLDISEEVVREAEKKKVDLIISHHPLLFRPPRSITNTDRIGRVIVSLIKSQISVYSMHTNYDFTTGGVSYALAERLGLKNVEFLQHQQDHLRKITVFVPIDYVEKVMEAMAKSGAGVIGRYDHCSFRVAGTGTFRGQKGTKPSLGRAEELEQIDEIRLEMIAPSWKMQDVVAAMRGVHPYEEVAYDVYVLDNQHTNYGAGAIGTLDQQITLKGFLQRMKVRLDIPTVRFAGDLGQRINIVAVCGGSGVDLLDAAISRDADVFVTADIKYHVFEAATGKIALVDAGHYETEQPSLDRIIGHLEKQFVETKQHIQVLKTSVTTNPVQYY